MRLPDSVQKNNVCPRAVKNFQKTVWEHYKNYKRAFVWRKNITPYFVVVSEIMLQQTQTSRVKEKFEQFVTTFPSFEILAQSPLAQVIGQWVGLGYNRRAIALHEIAKKVIIVWHGQVPNDPVALQSCKGIGPATAATITTFAFNRPIVFIETNIRAVFLHSFFSDAKEQISDAQLMPLIEAALDRHNPREWYYALMDYGVMLKKLYKNPSRKSKHYATQSRFEGSDRQIRGAILRLLWQEKTVSEQKIFEITHDKNRIQKILKDLEKEGFIVFCQHLSEFSLSK